MQLSTRDGHCPPTFEAFGCKVTVLFEAGLHCGELCFGFFPTRGALGACSGTFRCAGRGQLSLSQYDDGLKHLVATLGTIDQTLLQGTTGFVNFHSFFHFVSEFALFVKLIAKNSARMKSASTAAQQRVASNQYCSLLYKSHKMWAKSAVNSQPLVGCSRILWHLGCSF